MSDRQKDSSQAFDRKEAARRLGVSVVTIDRELARGNIEYFRSGRRVLFTQSHLSDYIKRNEHKVRREKA
jgi:excisionase family DNA binding protein